MTDAERIEQIRRRAYNLDDIEWLLAQLDVANKVLAEACEYITNGDHYDECETPEYWKEKVQVKCIK